MREELEQYLLQLTGPLQKHLSEGKTRLWLGATAAGFGIRTAGMEGLLRLLWGLTPYWAGGGTGADDWKEVFVQAVRNGTNPEHEEYWGDIGERDQKIVEMAALSCSFLMTPQIIWENLSEQEKKNAAAWLNQANRVHTPDNNWHFFAVLANLAMKKRGMPYSQERIDLGIARYEAFYLENGWYRDGERPQKDYYISFGIHFYCLLYAYFMEEEEPERCRIYRERAKQFAETFLYWFDDQGRALPFGRSMTYRFAQAAFLSAAVTVLKEECPHREEMKWLIRKHMEHWMAQPITDNGGVLTIGYHYPNLLMSEGYNSTGSPYWALKVFFCLSMDREDPFWTIGEKQPVWERQKAVPECDMLLLHRPGQVISLTAGQFPTVVQTHSEAKYAKFSYSSVFGFSVPRSSESLAECAPDSMLAFELNGKFYVRKKCDSYSVDKDGVSAQWSPADGITVTTRLYPSEKGYQRKHRIETKVECKIYECGFSYPMREDMQQSASEGEAVCRDANGCSIVRTKIRREAEMIPGEGRVIRSAPNTNLIYPLTAIPAVEVRLEPGVYEVETEIEAQMRPGKIVTGKGECYVLE